MVHAIARFNSTLVLTSDTYSAQEFLKILSGYVNVNLNNYIEFHAPCLQLIEVYLLIINLTEVKQQLSCPALVKFEQIVGLIDKTE